MKRFALSLIGLVLICPTSALAQKAGFADLVGQWARQGERTPELTLLADSTFVAFRTLALPMGGKPRLRFVGRWRMAGDTLVTSEGKVQQGGGGPVQMMLRAKTRVVKLNGQLLTLSEPAKAGEPLVYKRLDSPKP